MHTKREAVLIGTDEESSNNPVLLKTQLQSCDVWFISPTGLHPGRLIKQLLLEVGSPGLHLAGQFTEQGFCLAGHVLSSQDFPEFEQEQTHRTLNFWFDGVTGAGINEIFLGNVMKKTKLSIEMAILEEQGTYTRKKFFLIPPKNTINHEVVQVE